MPKLKKIAVYGLGAETRKELPALEEQYDIVGLLDGFQTEGMLYGQPVISYEKAVEAGIEKIIVVARPGSCKAIAKRIGDACKVHGIALFDIRGRNLLETEPVVCHFAGVDGYRYEDFLERIRRAETVSFDLFDTLLMRCVCFSGTVAELLAARLKERGMDIPGFADKRTGAEKRLSRSFAPGLTEIYETAGMSMRAEDLAEFEYETDRKLLIPRADMVRLFREAKNMGKPVYITTDIYYSRKQIEEILKDNGIDGYDGVFVSCEYGKSKQQGLFDVLKKETGTDRIFHIGDDIVSDIWSAKISGIDCLRIYSGEELFDMAGGLGLSAQIESLGDRIKAGMFTASLFNSPFQFEDEKRMLRVADAYDIGYTFCAPLVVDFVQWFGGQVKKLDCKNIWFCARDGFLIKKLYEKQNPDSVTEYFLTSRTSAIRAGVATKEDIAYVDRMKFSGETADNLKRRFGMDAAEISDAETDEGREGLLRYGKAILRIAEQKKENNRKYIDSLHIREGKIAFYDFVANGTSQFFTGRLVENPLVGLYFLKPEPESLRNAYLDIKSFYTEEEREKSAVFDNYYILETLLTSPEPSIEEFDKNGRPVYAGETRSDKDIACMMRAQEGILRFADTYLSICPESERHINKKLDEVILMLIHNVEILDQDFLELKVEDPFFNRMTKITDVL